LQTYGNYEKLTLQSTAIVHNNLDTEIKSITASDTRTVYKRMLGK